MKKDGKIYLPEKVKGIKVSLISAPNIPEGEAVMVVSQKDFDRLAPKTTTVPQYTSDQNYLAKKC